MATTIDPGPGFSTVPPGLRASVAVGVQPVTSRGKPISRLPTPEGVESLGLPAKTAPEEVTDARNPTPAGPGGPASPRNAVRVDGLTSSIPTEPFRMLEEVTERAR